MTKQGILSDTHIMNEMSQRIIPWDISCLNPASLDLRLGDDWYDITFEPRKIKSDVVTLYPHSLVYNFLHRVTKRFPSLILATTIERIDLPADIVAQVKLKTTPCRKGLGHPIADLVDPGFCGQLTLMLHAFKPIKLCKNQRICQLMFTYASDAAAKPYGVTGHYQNQTGPTLAWDR